MKFRKMLLLLILACLVLSGCRRRLMNDGSEAVRQTYFQEQPDPNLPGTSGTVTGGEPDPTGEAEKNRTPTAPPVADTTPAQGGESLPEAPTAPEPGAELLITLDPGEGSCAVASVTRRAGGAYGALPEAQRQGYAFKGWFFSPEGGEPVSEVTVITRREDHTLYAQWSERSGYRLLFDPNGGRISPYQQEKDVFPGSPYGELPTPTYRGYHFLGWFRTPEGGEPVAPEEVFTGGADETFYAHWEYDPLAYWSFVLENTTQQIFSCQETAVYLELEGRGQTRRDAALIAATGSQNIAQNREDPQVTDDWVLERKPNVVVKLTADLSAAHALEQELSARFPGCRILVLPLAALEGSEAEQLYYQLSLAKTLYPDWYLNVDLAVAARELGVEPEF